MTEYETALNEAWAASQAPRKPDALTIVSTFAGMGGSSLGYRMAGFDVRLAVEWDDDAATTYRLNFPTTPLFHGDIAELSVNVALATAGLEPGQLDVLDGSPPCQGFSTAGSRILEDPRNQLFRHFVRLLEGFKPRAFVMENVSGMVKGAHRALFIEILQTLKAAGYRVSARLLNAMWLGVPQMRQRLIFVGVREDLGLEPRHPKPGGQPIIASAAISGIDEDEAERAALLAAGNHFSGRNWALIQPGSDEKMSIIGNPDGSFFNHIKLHPGRPAATICASIARLGMGEIVHWAERRRPTRKECARFQSVPDQFQWPFEGLKRWSNAVQRMGNSVPPFMARAVALEIEKTLTGAARERAA